MKKLKTIFLSIITIVVLLTTSCEDLTEINTSPNQLNASDINIKYVLTSVLSNSATQYIRNFAYGATPTISDAMQYTQRDYIDYAGTNTFGWTPVDFSPTNSGLINSQYIVDHAKGEVLEGNQKFYTAVGQIMRSFYYGFMTSIWGDMPYADAMKATEGNFTPAYSAQKDIFKGILADLKSANELLASVTTVDGAAAGDIMYAGDVLKWRKFCNSLRLRYLIRLSEKQTDAGFDVKGEFNTIVGNPSTYPIFTSSSDNAAIAYPGSNEATSWPGGPLGWNNRSEYYRRKPCATFVNELVATGDPRLTTFIRPVDSQLRISSSATGYEKLADGQIVLNVSAAQVGSASINTARYVGLPPALGIPDLYNLSSLSNFPALKALNSTIYIDAAANPNVSYLGDIYSQNANSLVKAVYMSYAELSFILAEGRLKGWTTTPDAVDLYKQGITASLRQYAITDGSKIIYNPATYALENYSETAFIAAQASKYTSAATEADKLTVLMTQKWLATFMTPEFWFDWRRTGVPNLGKNLISAIKGDKIPVRYIYGTNEKILNATNYATGVATLDPATDDQWSKMWLLKGTNKPW
jgi:hypothetical protein